MAHIIQEKTPAGGRATFADEAVRAMLARNNLTRLDAIFERGATAPQRHTGRSVWDTHLVDDDGDRVHVYVKMSWGRQRLWPRMTDLKTGQWLQSLPMREWRGIAALAQLGLRVPQRLAVLHEGLLTFRAAVIVRAVPPPASVADLLAREEWARFDGRHRRQVLDGIAGAMRTIHTAGFGWRGTSAGHFYPEWTADGECLTWMIDCEGVHRRATRKTIGRDDRKLTRSFALAGADEPTLDMLQESLRTAAPRIESRAA